MNRSSELVNAWNWIFKYSVVVFVDFSYDSETLFADMHQTDHT